MTEPPAEPPIPPPPGGELPPPPPPPPAWPQQPVWQQPAGQQPAGQPGSPYEQPAKSGTNGFAIAALILGIIPICLLGVIFGIVALIQTSRSGQKGKGLAIAGIVLTGLWVAGGVTVAVINGMNTADRDTTGTIEKSGRLSVFDLKVGDCFNDKVDPGKRSSSVPAVPCSEPHTSEVFAVVPITGDKYPGDAVLKTRAESVCTSRMDAVDSRRVPHDAELHWFQPTKFYWTLNHRDISCIVVTQTKQAGSLLK